MQSEHLQKAIDGLPEEINLLPAQLDPLSFEEDTPGEEVLLT